MQGLCPHFITLQSLAEIKNIMDNTKIELTTGQQIQRVVYSALAVLMLYEAITDKRKWVPLVWIAVALLFGFMATRVGRREQGRRAG